MNKDEFWENVFLTSLNALIVKSNYNLVNNNQFVKDNFIKVAEYIADESVIIRTKNKLKCFK